MKTPGLSGCDFSAHIVIAKAGILSSFTNLSYEKFAKVPSIFSLNHVAEFGPLAARCPTMGIDSGHHKAEYLIKLVRYFTLSDYGLTSQPDQCAKPGLGRTAFGKCWQTG